MDEINGLEPVLEFRRKFFINPPVLHAESEWQSHLQQLVHERGIFLLSKSSVTEEPEWELCPIEGPYRMRKKLERCKLKIDTIQNILDGQFEIEEAELSKGKNENAPDASDSGSEPYFQHLTNSDKQNDLVGELYDASFFNKMDSVRDAISDKNEWNDDKASSINEASLHSALETGAKSSVVSVPIADSTQERSDLGSPRQSSSAKIDEVKIADDKSDKELHDNGEYLIRPFLEPSEKIQFKYNCERVVGLDKHDGIFLIGEFCLYVIEIFYIDDSGCFWEKECEDELSVIDQVLGVKKDVTSSVDFQSKSTSSWSTTVKSCVGGRAWAYGGGAWGKEKVHSSGNLPHPWRMWKLNSVHEILKRDYQLRPVAIEIFSMDGCNDLLVFHKKEREEVFKNLVAMNLPRNSMSISAAYSETEEILSYQKGTCQWQPRLPCTKLYPKVKVRLEQYQEDHGDLQNQNLRAFQSLSIHGSRSPVRDQKDVPRPSTAKVPKSYVPHVPIIPRVPVSENLGPCSLASDFSGLTGPERDGNTDEDKVNIRASSIPRPRAVVSSPDNDEMIGKKNSIKDERLSGSKNRSVLQNRQAPSKVKSSGGTDIPPKTRKSKETAGSTKIAPIRTNRTTKAASNQKTYLGTGKSSSIGV